MVAMAFFPALAMADEPAPLRPDQQAFRSLYKELIETDTSLSNGSCTLAAERMAARLKAAGLKDDQITLFSTPEHPKEGGLVAVWPGTSRKLKPILLLSHIDVVEARREDWERDPLTLIEELGYLYGRGTADDKAHAAVWVDTLIRFAQEGYRTRRGVKLALTCGEETNGAFNGAEWLAANRRDLIDAAFALNEGGGGTLGADGKVVSQTIQVGEKAFANIQLETRNPGGHSSVPMPENAIYQLAKALDRVEAHPFPIEFNETTRIFFRETGTARGDELGKAMIALAANPSDRQAAALVDSNPYYRALLRTTCVATMLEAGHARNALPQRAQANINCRIFPTHSVEDIRREIEAAIADPGVVVTALTPLRPAPPPPPLDEKVLGPIREVMAKHFPGATLVPAMAAGYTDSTFLTAAGIPSYGVPGFFSATGEVSGVHGLNERISMRSLYGGRDFLYDLVKAFTQ